MMRNSTDLMRVLFLAALFPFSSMGFINPLGACRPHSRSSTRTARSPICLLVNINSDDPFEILGLNEATTDKKVIKRAYKRMALKYHPDVLSTPQSSQEEKKAASDRFAKINWAYSQLSGKGEDNSTYKSKSNTQNPSSTGGWTPPHRRAGGSQGSNRGYASSGSDSVDWSDFIPKSDDSYDTDGDSFGKIFSDIFAGAATSAVSGGAAGSTLFKDFIEFLEGNVDGFGGTTGSDDSELQYLLGRGTREEIRNELDDTKLVVDQLTRKLRGIENEIFSATAELGETEKYLEKIRLEEIIAEMNARKKVVKGYLQKAEQRLLKLQIRYKETKRSNPQWDDTEQESASSSYSSTKYPSSAPKYPSSKEHNPDLSWNSEGFGSSSRTARRSVTSNDGGKQQSWKKEGFGSSARRGSRRRPETATESYKKHEAEPAYSSTSESTSESRWSTDGGEKSWRTEGFGSRRRTRRQDRDTQNQRPAGTTSGRSDQDRFGTSRSSGISSFGSSDGWTESVPPHRRATSSSNAQDDSKRRLREIVVDEEFEKLKRELGL
ncbi:unnamed protein product [Cylindrotheca closterium]|uniref:J domain-containing protein n=1 Tax=Cylindrotheca closterium TaxID=2856 RepID=A0AAD2D088_9STRA|nr:unnamed protein product [Cylindrotheca closterium]